MAIRVKFLLCIFLICSMESAMTVERERSKEERKIMNRSINDIVNSFEKEMKDQFGLMCTGLGGGMAYDVDEIGIDFLLHQKTSIEEARELEIRATERLIELINVNEPIRPYLRDPPWNQNRARVMIAFRDEYGKSYPEGVRLIFEAKGVLCYYGPKKTPNEVGITIKEEPYAEAKAFVENNPSCLKPIEKPQKKKKWFGWF